MSPGVTFSNIELCTSLKYLLREEARPLKKLDYSYSEPIHYGHVIYDDVESDGNHHYFY